MSVLSCKSVRSQKINLLYNSRNFSSSWNEVKSVLPYSMQCMLRGTPQKCFIYFMEFSGSWNEVKSALPPLCSVCYRAPYRSILLDTSRYVFSSIRNEVKSVLPPVCSVCYTGHST
jgi:hypothetical protein